MNTTTKWLCALLMMGAVIATAQDTDTELLSKYRKIYDDTTAEYETLFRAETQAWPIDYIKALKALQTQYQTSGNLDGWEIVNQELTRFRAEPTLLDITSPLAELSDLQDSYRNHATQIKDVRDSKGEALRDKYLTRLTELQQDLTRKGEFDAAFAIRDEIARVKPASNEPETPENKPQITKEDPHAGFVPEKRKPQNNGATVTRPGEPPPNREGMHFKMKTLSKTTQSPWSALVSVKLYEATNKERDSFEKDRFVGTVDGKKESDIRHVRAEVKMLKMGMEERNITLRVQYFAKPAGGSGNPRLVKSKETILSVLNAKAVYVDLPPVTIESISRTINNAKRKLSKTTGNIFYGYIVTVLHPDNTVLYQGVTTAGLRELAIASSTYKKADPIRFDEGPSRIKRIGR